MIVAKISGGLGNQMFQYAAARALANQHRVDLMLDLSWFNKIPSRNTQRSFELLHYPIEARIANIREEAQFSKYHSRILRNIPSVGKEWIYKRERHFQFDPLFFEYPENSYLDGYWQSSLYFEKFSDQIWSQFQPKQGPGSRDLSVLDSINKTNSVAIHIRRGDYFTNSVASKVHGVCSLDYYSRALNFIREHESNPHFYIFSDDLDWVSKNLALDGPAKFIDHNAGDNAFKDLRLMAACSHQIIANSSFSWWGAWLNKNPQKKVLAPSKWFISAKNISTLLPKSWITI
jgi:hypothetical protein